MTAPLSFIDTAILGAIAGFTIYLGLPVSKLSVSKRAQDLLNGGAIGVLIFLLVEILMHAFEPVEHHIEDVVVEGAVLHPLLPLALIIGFSTGLVGLVWYNETQYKEASGHDLALMIAVGIGLHNFSEGLAIGQAAASGTVSLAFVLIVGFALHNITEGFGIAAPLTGTDTRYGFLARLGLIGGGPVLIGTLIGQVWTSTIASVLFLALAGGALIAVIYELLQIERPQLSDTLMFTAVTIGFFAGIATDIIVSIGMAL